MKFLLAYVKKYRGLVAAVMGIKLAGTFTELLIPYALEHMIDQVVPQKSLGLVVLFGLCMLGLAVVTRFLNVFSSRMYSSLASSKLSLMPAKSMT